MVEMEPTAKGLLEEALQSMNNDSGVDTLKDEYAQVKSIILTSQYIMTTIGAVANLSTLIVLRKAAKAFSPVYLFLLKAQAIIDFLVCMCGSALVLQKPYWNTGNFIFDTIICQFWHSQGLYFTFILYSIWNLIIIAVERFLAICKPFSHGDFTLGKAYKLSVLMAFVCTVANTAGMLQTKMEGDLCVSQYLIPGETGVQLFFVMGFWFFIIYYSAPTVIFMALYGKVIVTLVKRRDDSNLGESQLVNSAAKQMTNTAIAVTLIFIFSLSWDVIYFMLGRAGAVIYFKNSVIQMIGLWLSSLNSCANPFVYFVLLPAFRKSTISVFCPCMSGKKETPAGGGENSSGNTK